MRFEEILEDYAIEDWIEYYIDYHTLFDQLNKLSIGRGKARSDSFSWNSAHLPVRTESKLDDMRASLIRIGEDDRGSFNPSVNNFSLVHAPLTQKSRNEKQIWDDKFREHIRKTEAFFHHKRGEIRNFYEYFLTSLQKIYSKDAFQSSSFFSEMHQKAVSPEQISLKYGNKKIVSEIFTEVLCLESFCLINKLAINVLLKYYNTKFSDDLVDGDASTYFEIDQYEFRTSDNMSILKDKIKDYVVENITNGNKRKAYDILRKNHSIKMTDLAKISFLLGIVCSTLFVLIVAAYIEFKAPESNKVVTIFFSSFQVYRFVFCTLLCCWYMTICRYVLHMRHLNFNFVLDIRHSNMVELHKAFSIQAYGTFLFLIAALTNIFFSSSVASSGEVTPNLITLLLFLSFMITLLIPSKNYLLDTKFALAVIMVQCFAAPFTEVTFMHILIADCYTSVNKVSLDIANSFLWVYAGGWKDTSKSNDTSIQQPWLIILILALPYYVRFMQCIKRYYVTRLVFPNIYNAIKYALSITTLVLANLSLTDHPSLLIPFLIIGFISFFYNNYWDNYNDWGLWRSWDKKNKFLRPRLSFAPNFYYTIMILNFFLRLNWMATLLPKQIIISTFKDANLFTLVTETLEITRRFLWTIIRIEYELFSNFERLRDFWSVPGIYYLKNHRKRKIQPI